MKAKYPSCYYVFAGPDHTMRYTNGSIQTPSLAQQADNILAIGADGIKLIETKNSVRKTFGVSIDSEYYEDFFAKIEQAGLPIVWHVNDPEEFWEPEKAPPFAKERNNLYDDTHVSKEAMYAEVENVLERHPQLKVIFAHFYFLSADLPRAEALLKRYANVHFDLAPGLELYTNLSRDYDAAREFFIRYADRIIYGTDIASRYPPEDSFRLADFVYRWLATDETLEPWVYADYYGSVRGLSLPEDVLEKICRKNFHRLAGDSPKPLDAQLARRECERIAEELEKLEELDLAAQVKKAAEIIK
jgi:predicted TIM-barrel fold metal-dependent hydrolase